MNHDFDGSSSTSSWSFKGLKWLLQFEMMSDKRFDIHCSRRNQGQGFRVTRVKERWDNKTNFLQPQPKPPRK